jgi:hypothetical protein
MSKPTQRLPDIGNSGRVKPGIPQIVLASTLTGLAYTILVVIGAERPESLLGRIIQTWVAFTRHLVDVALFLAPAPNFSPNSALEEKIADYRHLLVVCTLIMVWSVLSSRAYWPHWAECLEARLGAGHGQRRSATFFLIFAYRTTILGIIAVAFLMLFGEPRGERAVTFLYAGSWSFFRAPVLTAVACGLACRAAALWHCLTHER